MADLSGVEIRRATERDLVDCHRVWRDGIVDYAKPLGFPELPADNPAVRRLHAHALATDPGRFLVAELTNGAGRSHVAAFGSAVERGPLWFLSMLFVEPGEQARGLGRALLQRMLPLPLEGRVLATCTDSAQPISNGLYATLRDRAPDADVQPHRAATARVRLARAAGRCHRRAGRPTRCAGATAQSWPRSTARCSASRTRTIIASSRTSPATPSHSGAADGGLLGYGYAGEIGRIGPIAVTDRALLTPVLGHLLAAVEPRGASAVWLPGATDDAIATAVNAGLRMEGLPILVGWSRPFADFARYVPISPGLI